MEANLKYGINDIPRKWYEWILYPIQQVLSIFVATILIANICNTNMAAALVGAGIGTLIYLIITKFKSPMFISSSGAFVSAVCGALAIGNGNNYTAVVLGGIIIAIIYSIFALFIKLFGIKWLNKLLPPIIVGPVIIVIGINLAKFLPTYLSVGGNYDIYGVIVGFVTLLITACSSHYFKGFLKTIPFLLGMIGGYIIATIFTLIGLSPLIDFSKFNQIQLFNRPDFSFLHLSFTSEALSQLPKIILLFVPLALVAICEHIGDHKALSVIIGTDLIEKPGLHRTLLGDGLASFAGTLLCGLPNTSYGESVATTGFSRVASTALLSIAAVITGLLGFFGPIQVFLNSIPSAVFGGCAMILYGFIASSGLKMLIKEQINLNDNKNIVIVSAILTIGIGGIVFDFGWIAFSATSLSLIVGVILNLILRTSKR